MEHSIFALKQCAYAIVQAHASGAFLHYSRNSALFTSDAPKHMGDLRPVLAALKEAGYDASPEHNLLHISPGALKLAALEDGLPEPRNLFLKSFSSLRGKPITDKDIRLIIEGIKLCDTKATLAQTAIYEKRMRQSAALALRTGSGGGLYLCAYMIAHMKKGEQNT